VSARVHEQCYGDDNEEQEEGLQCIAVPVFERFGRVIAGLWISFRPCVAAPIRKLIMLRC